METKISVMDSATIARIKTEVSGLLQAQEYDLAYAALDPACNDEQTDVELWFTLAKVCHALSDFPGIIRSCRGIISLCPDHSGALFNLGVALFSEGKNTEAELHFQKVLELEPDHASAHDCLGQLLESQGDSSSARQQYVLATGSQHARAEHFQHLAGNQTKARHYELAEANYLTALSMDKRDPRVYIKLGQVQCELGRITEAISAFESALGTNPDLQYARYWLSIINDRKETDDEKHRGVSRMFDTEAAGFEDKLVKKLGYCTPRLIGDLVKEFTGAGEKLDILDLGCGTGLCADTLGELAGRMVGVDLSQKMLECASIKGRYSELVQGEIVEVMLRDEHQYDLVVAADVFIYVGVLDGVFPACLQVLKPGGMLVFSVEVSDAEDCKLRATARYAHSNEYIEQLALQAGYMQLARKDIDLRLEEGKMIAGRIYLYRKPSE